MNEKAMEVQNKCPISIEHSQFYSVKAPVHTNDGERIISDNVKLMSMKCSLDATKYCGSPYTSESQLDIHPPSTKRQEFPRFGLLSVTGFGNVAFQTYPK